MKEYALVLSGGGAKGVYHIGAWKAIKELGIPVKAFFGNSIGAIIAAFLAQGLEEELNEVADEIDISYILNLPKEMLSKSGELIVPEGSDIPKLLGDLFKSRGIDTSPLLTNLQRYLSEDAIRQSGNDYGLVTFNLSDFSPHELSLREIEKGRLIDYIMASSALPGFKSTKINGKTYIDGGFHDNIPFNLAKRRGYKNIIVIDMSGLGFKKKMDFTGTNTAYVKSSIKMGGALNFEKEFLSEFLELGYLDTLKTFGRLEGLDYFIEPDPCLERAFESFLDHNAFLYQECSYQHRNTLAVYLDCMASVLNIKRIKKWSYISLLTNIKRELLEIQDKLTLKKNSDIQNLEQQIKSFIRSWELEESPYFYYLLTQSMNNSVASKLLLRALKGFYPRLETAAAIIQYIDAISMVLNKRT